MGGIVSPLKLHVGTRVRTLRTLGAGVCGSVETTWKLSMHLSSPQSALPTAKLRFLLPFHMYHGLDGCHHCVLWCASLCKCKQKTGDLLMTVRGCRGDEWPLGWCCYEEDTFSCQWTRSKCLPQANKARGHESCCLEEMNHRESSWAYR